MEIARIEVSGAMAHVRYRNLVPAGLVGGYITVHYCDTRWEGLTKTVIFKGIETKDVVTQNETIEIPAETVAVPGKHLQVGFYGTDADDTLVIPTLWADIGFIQPAADPSGDTSTDPALPVYAQLSQQIVELREQVENMEPGGSGEDGEDGGYYTPAVTQPSETKLQFAFTPSKADMPAVQPVQVTLPAGQGSGGNVDYAGVEPAEDDIPKIFFGGALQQTKDETVVPFRYISKTEEIIGFAEIKAQGNSSMSYPKKNQTVKMFKDADCTEKLKVDFKGWGKQNKHVYKANWIDLTHARNVVSARLWGDVLRSRADYESLPELLRTSPNQGAVDGFPVKVYAAGVYQGRYTLNIPKDKWTFNMDDELDEHCVLCGENYVSGCFRAAANINGNDWTDEIHDVVPESIKTRWNEVISFVMNSTDEEFKTNLSQYFYVDSLIDYYLFGLASCGLDAFGKNQIYATYDGQRWIASMYDMDSTWGLYWNGSKFVATDYARTSYEDFVNTNGNLLYIRLEKLFWAELQTRWAELKNGALSIDNIINRFERFTDIAPAELVKEDYASTTGDGKFTGIPSQTTNNIQQIRAFALARQAWTDEFISALTGGGEVEPEDPEVPEITLTSISATYTGGNVAVGTALTDLTGITVTAHYSDGSTANVTDYTLSGTIAEGSNTITVNYGGMTTTFAVTGEAETADDTLPVYNLEETTVFNGTDTYIDTGVQLFDTDKDFTVFIEWQGSTKNLNQGETHTVLHAMHEQSPWNGLTFHIVANSLGYEAAYGRSLKNGIVAYNDTEVHKTIFRRVRGTNTISYRMDNETFELTGTYVPITETALLGCYRTTDDVKGRFWNGTIYECKIWERALSEDEIATLMA